MQTLLSLDAKHPWIANALARSLINNAILCMFGLKIGCASMIVVALRLFMNGESEV